MEKTPEFIALYPRCKPRFGAEYDMDQTLCCEMVWNDSHRGSKQCQRKNGHGPHGAYCKLHDPVAIRAAREKSNAKWNEKWEASQRRDRFEERSREAVRLIAAGHNDPTGLCREIIAELEGPK